MCEIQTINDQKLIPLKAQISWDMIKSGGNDLVKK